MYTIMSVLFNRGATSESETTEVIDAGEFAFNEAGLKTPAEFIGYEESLERSYDQLSDLTSSDYILSPTWASLQMNGVWLDILYLLSPRVRV